MPTYEYACTTCGHHLDAVQSFTDDPLTICPDCGGPLRKVYGAVGIVLKGSGFYKTDSRATNGSTNGAGVKSGDIYATVVQQPFEFGRKAMELMAQVLGGDKSVVPDSKQIFIPTLAIKKDTVDDFKAKLDKLRQP